MTIKIISIYAELVNAETKVYKKKIPLGEESGYFHKNSKMNFVYYSAMIVPNPYFQKKLNVFFADFITVDRKKQNDNITRNGNPIGLLGIRHIGQATV